MLNLKMLKFVKMLSLAIAFLFSSNAYAQSGPWVVSEKSGSVSIGQNGITKLAITGNRLRAGDTVKTGKRGRVVLTRGEQYLVVSPNSHIRIAQPKTDGALTQIVEYFGSVLFKVDKKKDAHFQVKTPYMAAVVKGTTFNVVVGPQGSTVQVTEGAVEVATLDGTASELLTPGLIGTVQRDNPFSLNIIDGGKTRVIGPQNNAVPSTLSVPKAPSAKIKETVNVSADLSDLTGSLIVGRTAGLSSEIRNNNNRPVVAQESGIDNVTQQVNRVVQNNRNNNANNPVDNGNGNGNNGNGNGNGGSQDDDGANGNGNGNNGNGNGNGGSQDDDGANGNGNGNNGNGNGNGGSQDDDDDGANGNGNGNNGNGNGNGGSQDDDDDGANGNGNGNNGNGNGNGGNQDDDDDGANGNGNGNGGNQDDDDDGGNGNGNGNGSGNGNGRNQDDEDEAEDEDNGRNPGGRGRRIIIVIRR